MYIPVAVASGEVSSIWDEIHPLIKSACNYNGNRSTAEDYFNRLINNDQQLWIVKDEEKIRAVIITQITQFPQKKCCSIEICTGEGVWEWGHFVSIIEEWASSLDCDQMFLIARPGMERILREFDYKKTHVIFEKDLISREMV